MSPGSVLGHRVLRTEDPGILLGETRYLDDLALPGALHAVFVRSTAAHARLAGVDTAAAAAMPGVAGVYTAADLGLTPMTFHPMGPPTMARPPLAAEVVRFVGDAVAVVVAGTRAEAVDAAGEVVVDYEPLPVVVDPLAAATPGAPVLFPEHGSNVVHVQEAEPVTGLFDDADVVVSARFVNQRLSAVPLEVNGAAAVPEPDGRLTVWVSSQHPFAVRAGLAKNLGIPEEQLRVVCPAMGGGFGAKVPIYVEHVVMTELARRLGRPVRYMETRSESMMALAQGRGQVQDVEIGARSDGTVVGLRVHVTGDAGAYPMVGAFLPATMTRLMASGVYRVPKLEFKATAVVTNTTPTAAYRGAGRPEAAALVERAVDLVAAELRLDPVEVRRRNLIPPDAFPHSTATGARYDVGDYGRALDEALRLAGYDDLRKEQAQRRERGDPVVVGIGVSTYVEVTGGPGPAPEFGSVEVNGDGSATARAGTSAQGQGHETAFAQIVSATLGVPLESVRVVHSDTDAVESGMGTYGSRSLQLAGTAVLRAAEAVLEQARHRAAELLEANPDDVVLFEDGRVGVAGSPASALSWAELAAGGDRLHAAERFDQGAHTFPFGAHVSVVDVDTETGSIRLRRHVSVDDCGRILNPILVEGQIHGGLAQGIAQALWEAVAYDEDGMPLTTTLADYLVPSAAELVGFETAHTETATPLNPLGAKGVGESGTTGSTPAVQSAVIDALAHLGVRHVEMPATPERVWRAIREAHARARPSA